MTDPLPVVPELLWEMSRSQLQIHMNRFSSEAEMQSATLNWLSQWFHVDEFVPGKHWSGKTLILDAVLQPIDNTEWFDHEPTIGIEFKLKGQGHGTSIGAWFAQCVDEAETEWNGYGRMKIFMCPSPYPLIREQMGEVPTSLVSKLLAAVGIGELAAIFDSRTHEKYMALVLASTLIWSSNDGVGYGKFQSLKPKTGSRA